jgi:hypothetical protein
VTLCAAIEMASQRKTHQQMNDDTIRTSLAWPPNTRIQPTASREIVAIWECDSARSRRLMRNSLGGREAVPLPKTNATGDTDTAWM